MPGFIFSVFISFSKKMAGVSQFTEHICIAHSVPLNYADSSYKYNRVKILKALVFITNHPYKCGNSSIKFGKFFHLPTNINDFNGHRKNRGA